MITVEDKIRTFSKYVYDKELKIKEELVSETREKYDRMLEGKKKELVDQYNIKETKQKKKIELEAQKILSQSKMKARDKIFESKNAIMEDLLSSVLDEL